MVDLDENCERRDARRLTRYPHAPDALIRSVAARLDEPCRERDVGLLSLTPGTPKLILDPERLGAALRALALSCLEAPGRGGRLLLAALPAGADVSLTIASDRPGWARAFSPRLPGAGGLAVDESVALAVRNARSAAEAHGGCLDVLCWQPNIRLQLHLPIDPEDVAESVTSECTFSRSCVRCGRLFLDTVSPSRGEGAAERHAACSMRDRACRAARGTESDERVTHGC